MLAAELSIPLPTSPWQWVAFSASVIVTAAGVLKAWPTVWKFVNAVIELGNAIPLIKNLPSITDGDIPVIVNHQRRIEALEDGFEAILETLDPEKLWLRFDKINEQLRDIQEDQTKHGDEVREMLEAILWTQGIQGRWLDQIIDHVGLDE